MEHIKGTFAKILFENKEYKNVCGNPSLRTRNGLQN